MKEIQTPRSKDFSITHRRPKTSPSSKSSTSDHSTKSKRMAKKNLEAVFSSETEELLSDAVTEAFHFSPDSEILSDSNINYTDDSTDSFECIFAGEEASSRSDWTTSSKITTVGDDSPVHCNYHGKVLESESFECISAEEEASPTPSDLTALSMVTTTSDDYSPMDGSYLGKVQICNNVECMLAREEALTLSDLTTSTKISTVNYDSSTDCSYPGKVLVSDSCVQAEMVANLLKEARDEVCSSSDVSSGSKKLLDSLLEDSVKQYFALREEKRPVHVPISEKTRVLVFCFVVWLISTTVFLIFFCSSSGRNTSSFYLPPT